MKNPFKSLFKLKRIRSTKGNVFLTRLSFYLKKGSIKLHIITGDDSPEYHTHPWDFTSFILFGGYREYIMTDWYEVGRQVAEDSMSITYHSRVPKPGLFMMDIEDTRGFITGYKCRMFSINKKHHDDKHRVELFRLFGFKIPCITIGWYSHKLQLCSFCKQAGRCLSNDKYQHLSLPNQTTFI